MTGTSKPIRSSWPWIVTACAWTLAGSLACRLAALPVFSETGAGTGTVAQQILGRTTSAFADYSFYQEADGFYHKGRSHYVDTAFTNDFFQAMRRQIAPVGHAHAQGKEVKDVLAWLRIAISLDPANTEYSLVAAYWLQRELGMTDAALEVLRESSAANPGAYEPYIGRGRLYARIGDRERSRKAYEMALARWPGGDDPNDEDPKIAKREILLRLSIICEVEGDIQDAISYLRQIVAVFPDSSRRAGERAAMLERGELPPLSAIERWNVATRAEDHHFCEEETDEHTGSHDHDQNGEL